MRNGYAYKSTESHPLARNTRTFYAETFSHFRVFMHWQAVHLYNVWMIPSVPSLIYASVYRSDLECFTHIVLTAFIRGFIEWSMMLFRLNKTP